MQPKVEVTPVPQLHPRGVKGKKEQKERRSNRTDGEGGGKKATSTGSLILIHFILQNATQWEVGQLTTTTTTKT